jgi:ubiquinone/menaquinone biosynthesis C-methylase UbiE
MNPTEEFPPISIEQLYGTRDATGAAFYSRLDRSLLPRGPDMLFDRMAALGISNGDHLVDVGCRDARHSCELASRFSCRVLAIDPIEHNLAKAKRLVHERSLSDRVALRDGSMEAIPCPDGTVDYLWCRDVTNHVASLENGFRQCARVLKSGGTMLLYQTFATDSLEPREAAKLYSWTATVPRNMVRDSFEASLRGSGLRIAERDVVSSEWREYGEEQGNAHTSRQLLRLARLGRDRTRLVAEFGRAEVDAETGDCLWGVYQMLGKLCPVVYVLVRD